MNMLVEGEPSKRYRISYWGGEVFESHWDTAKEALDRYEKHRDLIKPQIDKDPRAKKHKPTYSFRDGRKEITLADLRKAAKAEEEAT
jgi:hypothetical protein